MEKIRKIQASEILDSRGNSTLKVKIYTDNFESSASVPHGKSIGRYEALSLPTWQALKNIKEKITPILIEKEVDFKLIDQELISLDGKKDKSNLGANTTLGISLASARLQAKIERRPLFKFLSSFFPLRKTPREDITLLMNIVNGGMHAFGGPDIQEYLILVKGINLKESVFLGSRIYHEMGKSFKRNIGDEGGFVPEERDVTRPIDIISRVIGEKGVRKEVKIGLDVAASQLFDGEKYHLGDYKFTKDELVDFYLKLSKKYELLYLEDPFSEDDLESFAKLKKESQNFLVVGDDLTVTNLEKTKEVKENDLISGIIIKPNQIGTLSETIDVINFAQEEGLKVIISHRSGETNDSFIADLAVACGAWGLKTGAPARGERVAKYNRLLEIEDQANLPKSG